MLIKVSNLSFSYNKNQVLFNNLSFLFQGAGLYSISGQNGIGKTTLLKLLGGLLNPRKGRIFINDVDIVKNYEYPFVSSSLFLSPTEFEKEETLKSIIKFLNISRNNEILKSLKIDINKQYGILSEGQKNKFRIYCAMFSKGIVLLDEPLKSLDEKGKELVSELLLDLSTYKLLVITSPEKTYLVKKSKHNINLSGGQIV